MIKTAPYFILIIFTLFLTGKVALAQEASFLNISDTVPITESVEDGDVVVSDSGVYKKSTKPYDSNLVGVVSLNSAISFGEEATPSGYSRPVAARGSAQVRVSTENGPIKAGDLITSSSKPGIAMKASREGYVLGTALNDYTSQEVGKIGISLNIRPYYGESLTNRNFSEVFNISRLAVTESPVTVFRYLLAAVLVILSCIAGFLIFGRVAASGVEAIARNPLVGKKIQFSVILNTIITLGVMGAGVFIAYLILKA